MLPDHRPHLKHMWHTLKAWLLGSGPSAESGTLADARAHLQRLLAAPHGSFLVIEVAGVEDAFLQFTADPHEIQIDHPLVTPVQLEREDMLRRAFVAAGFTPYETPGSDGTRFLDCNVPRDAAGAATVVRTIFETAFGATASTEFRFIGAGLPPVA